MCAVQLAGSQQFTFNFAHQIYKYKATRTQHVYMQMQDDDVSERPYIHGQIMTYVTYSMAEFLKASSTDGSWRPMHAYVYNRNKRMSDASMLLSHTTAECPPDEWINLYEIAGSRLMILCSQLGFDIQTVIYVTVTEHGLPEGHSLS